MIQYFYLQQQSAKTVAIKAKAMTTDSNVKNAGIVSADN